MGLLSGIDRLWNWFFKTVDFKGEYTVLPPTPLFVLRIIWFIFCVIVFLLPVYVGDQLSCHNALVRFFEGLVFLREYHIFVETVAAAPDSEAEIKRYCVFVGNGKWRMIWAVLGSLYSPLFPKRAYGYLFPLASIVSVILDRVVKIRQIDGFRKEVKAMNERKTVENQMKKIIPLEYNLTIPSRKSVHWYTTRINILEGFVIKLHSEVAKYRALTTEEQNSISMNNVD